MAMTSSFSQYLVSLNPDGLRKATQHLFLAKAARGTLPQEQLKAWLAQDRLYALSYVTFMGQLLSKVPVSFSADRTSTLNWRITDCLIDCLDNIRTELKLFEDTAAKYGWMEQLGAAQPNVHTQAYRDLFAGAGQPSATLFRGMVALWATEKCYLLAWTHARGQMPTREKPGRGEDIMQDVFIPNWSSDDFVKFVDVLEELVNEMAKAATEEDIEQAKQQWTQIIWAEEAFWPNVDE
jgi:thiaminase